MELIERPNLNAVAYLNSIQFDDFKNDCIREAELNGDKKPTSQDIKTWYTILKQFCKTNIKTQGITKRIYSYSLSTPAGLGGRLFCSNSLQSIWSVYRGLLMRGIGTDIDMSNAHPTILRYICKIHNIHCPQLEYFIQNRDQCLAEFDSRNIGKKAYLAAVNSDKYSKRKNPSRLFKLFDDEMGWIQKQIISKPEYYKIIQTVPDSRELNNFNGSAVNRILCYYENIILQHAIHVFNKRGIEIAILMFDGLMVYGNYYSDYGLLKEIEEYVETQMPGLEMKWAYKEHDQSMTIPVDFNSEDAELASMETFEKVAKEFEKTHAKIENSGIFVSQQDDKIIMMSRQTLKCAYEHMVYEQLDKKTGTIKRVNFINDWLVNNPDQRRYDDVGIYPNEKKCPNGIFNVWTKFAMERVQNYNPDPEALEMILHHMKILCDHDDSVYNYLLAWVAQMIQFPEEKSVCPTFISKEGAGKGTFITLLKRMLGESKYLEVSDPQKSVFGSFNSAMASAFLVNLNEISKKDTLYCEGMLKALITDPTIIINQKGVSPYQIQSYHRFIITTNNEDPIATSKNDRRKFIVRCSDEKIGDIEYFKKLNELLEDDNVLKTCYEFFKNMPGIDKFREIPLPRTEYQEELKESNECPVERWIPDFVKEHIDEGVIELKADDAIQAFNAWCSTNNVSYNINSIQLLTKIGRLKIDGIKKKVHWTGKRITIFDIPVMKVKLGLGFLGEVDPEP